MRAWRPPQVSPLRGCGKSRAGMVSSASGSLDPGHAAKPDRIAIWICWWSSSLTVPCGTCVALKRDLERVVGGPVDVMTEGGLSPYIRDSVLAEALPL